MTEPLKHTSMKIKDTRLRDNYRQRRYLKQKLEKNQYCFHYLFLEQNGIRDRFIL